MKRSPVNYKFYGAGAVALFSLSATVSAGQIDSVCKTDNQTLNSIKSDPDQTLWIFMQTVCQGQFVITQSSVGPQPLAVSPFAVEVAPLNAEVLAVPIARVDSPAQSGQARDGIDLTSNQDEAVATRIKAESLAKQNSMEVATQFPAANLPHISLAKREPSPEQSSVETVAAMQLEKTVSNQGSRAIQTDEASGVQAVEDQETEDKGHQSSRPWLYSLLGPQVPSPVIDALPPPIEYNPSRFSNYKPDYYVESTASNHGKGYLQKPEVMSVTPHGLFASLYWHSYREPGVMKQSGPGFALGYVDERAIREWMDYPGMGSRVELGGVRLNYKGTDSFADSGTFTNNAYYFLGEFYQPISSGVFTGLGYRRLNDKKVPDNAASLSQVTSSTGKLVYDRLSEYLYLPIGIAGKIGTEATYKLQVNALIRGQQTSRLWFADGDVKKEQRNGWGLDLTYAPSNTGEIFLRYWNIDDSETTTGRVTGLTWIEPKNETVEAGLRAWW